MALYPIRLLKDKNRHPFFPLNTLESVLVDGTNLTLKDVLDDIYTKSEINTMFATELSKFSVYDSVSELPVTARDGAVAAIDDNNTYIMYIFYNNSWHALTQKGDTGSQGPAGPYFTPSVNAAGDLSWTNNGGLNNPTTVNIKGPQGIPGPSGGIEIIDISNYMDNIWNGPVEITSQTLITQLNNIIQNLNSTPSKTYALYASVPNYTYFNICENVSDDGVVASTPSFESRVYIYPFDNKWYIEGEDTAQYQYIPLSSLKFQYSGTSGDVYDVTYINTMLGNIESLLGGI